MDEGTRKPIAFFLRQNGEARLQTAGGKTKRPVFRRLNSDRTADYVAERGGFEPTVPCGTPDFESGTFGHSATSPLPSAHSISALHRLSCNQRPAAQVGLQGRRNSDAAVCALVILVSAASLNFASQSLACTEITHATLQAASCRPGRAAGQTEQRCCRLRAGNFQARRPAFGLRRGRSH